MDCLACLDVFGKNNTYCSVGNRTLVRQCRSVVTIPTELSQDSVQRRTVLKATVMLQCVSTGSTLLLSVAEVGVLHVGVRM